MLDIDNKKILKTIAIYLILTVICFIFSAIYLSLSFGIVSLYMKYLAVIPLIGEAIFGIVYMFKIKISRLSYNLFNASIFTLSVGSTLQGVLEICGSSSKLIYVFFILAVIELIISIVNWIIFLKKEKENAKKKRAKRKNAKKDKLENKKADRV